MEKNGENIEIKKLENDDIEIYFKKDNDLKSKKSKKKIILVIGIVSFLAVGSVVLASYILNNSSEKEDLSNKGNVEVQEKASNKESSSNSSNSSRNNSMFGAKPILYFYPTEKVNLSVKLGKPENITHSYPKYSNVWNIEAYPDGKLVENNSGRKLYSLYREGILDYKHDFEDGFIVKGEDTISFLEEKLAILGLNEYEAEEFIIYWLPKLESNKYNFIRFATFEEISKIMPIEFSLKPDSIIRILMQYKAVDEYFEIEKQELISPQREGFVVVEWGGSEVR